MGGMKRNRLARALVLVGLLGFIASASGDAAAKEKEKPKREAKRRPSTPAERTAGAKAARQLELDPLGPESDARQKAAMVVLNAPDIQVPLCANVLASFANEKSAHHDALLQQMLFSTMAFMVEQPERASDVQADFLAGILGALKAYAKIREAGPDARSPFLEQMLGLQKRGELEAFYKKETTPCVAGAKAAMK
jgi:hypothetical protein